MSWAVEHSFTALVAVSTVALFGWAVWGWVGEWREDSKLERARRKGEL